jgi:hypothetical protein
MWQGIDSSPVAITVREPGGAAIDGVTDAECVTRVLAGDNTAFETLVRRHARAAYALAFAFMRDADEAEDIARTRSCARSNGSTSAGIRLVSGRG